MPYEYRVKDQFGLYFITSTDRSSRCSEGQSRSLDKKDFQSATNEITLR